MKIFRKPSKADSTGDAIPFYHDGKYHIFSLTPPPGTTVYPARLRTSLSHTVSENLIDWEEHPTALYPGEDESEPDASGIWTGSAIYGEGKFHYFYTGYSLKCKYQQTICHATSEDGDVWVKDTKNPVIIPKTDEYEPLDWRDPYVFYNEDDKCYWILISARQLKINAAGRRGCIVLYRSKDLENWEYYGPIYEPGHTNCPECAEMYKIGDKWYLSYSRFSEFVDTIYRVSDSPFGPWRTPEKDGIGGRRFYAAKSMEDKNGRRFYFGWAHDRGDNCDTGEWYWGGIFCLPHEVVQNEKGELDVKAPQEIIDSINQPVEWKLVPAQGEVCSDKDSISLKGTATTAFAFLDQSEESLLFSGKLIPKDCRGKFGMLFKSDINASLCLMLEFDPAMQRVSLLNLPMDVDPFWQQSCQAVPPATSPGPDGIRVCQKPFTIADGREIDIKAVIDGDMVELFIGKKVAFTYRIYHKPEFELGFIVEDGDLDCTGISLTK